MSERLSDRNITAIIEQGNRLAFPNKIHLLAREVQEWRNNDWANALADLKLSGDMIAVRDLCARHGLTVEGIVALVDEVFSPDNDSWLATLHATALRRLARGEEA